MVLRWPILSLGLLLWTVPQCYSAELAECIIMDPRDGSSFDTWTDCSTGEAPFTVIEYGEERTEVTPYDPEGRFALTNSGGGQFCMQSPLATTLDENLFSEIVYRIDSQQSGANLYIAMLQEDSTEIFVYTLSEVGDWVVLSGWLDNRGVYKVSGFGVMLG